MLQYKQKMKSLFASLLLGFLIVLFWHTGYGLSCLFLIVPVIFWAVLLHDMYGFRLSVRRCQAACWLDESTPLYRLMTGGIFVFVVSAVESALLAAILALFIPTLSFLELSLLLVDAFALLWLYRRFDGASFFKKPVRSYAGKRLLAHMSALALTALFLIVALEQTPPPYLHDSLSHTIDAATLQTFSRCGALDTLMRLVQAFLAAKWWVMLSMSATQMAPLIKSALWTLFLAGNYLAMLAYGLYILHLYTLLRRLGDEK